MTTAKRTLSQYIPERHIEERSRDMLRFESDNKHLDLSTSFTDAITVKPALFISRQKSFAMTEVEV